MAGETVYALYQVHYYTHRDDPLDGCPFCWPVIGRAQLAELATEPERSPGPGVTRP